MDHIITYTYQKSIIMYEESQLNNFNRLFGEKLDIIKYD